MKINETIAIEGPDSDGAFTWVITGRRACMYYSMPRNEADLVRDILFAGTPEWQAQMAQRVRLYVEKGEPAQMTPPPPVEAYDQYRDPGDENRPPAYCMKPEDDPDFGR